MKKLVIRILDAFTCFVRKVSRPVAFAGVAVGTWVNLVLIPIVKWEVPPLAEAAAWITAVGALSWVRHMDKVKGVAD
jgi:hypothetical protein